MIQTITDKNNNVSSEDRHYYKYPWTRLDISDNVCLDLQNCCYSVYVTKLISKSRLVGSFLRENVQFADKNSDPVHLTTGMNHSF
jgi:hypothetical protein